MTAVPVGTVWVPFDVDCDDGSVVVVVLLAFAGSALITGCEVASLVELVGVLLCVCMDDEAVSVSASLSVSVLL